MKTCTKCGVEYQATREFFFLADPKTGRLRGDCKRCKGASVVRAAAAPYVPRRGRPWVRQAPSNRKPRPISQPLVVATRNPGKTARDQTNAADLKRYEARRASKAAWHAANRARTREQKRQRRWLNHEHTLAVQRVQWRAYRDHGGAWAAEQRKRGAPPTPEAIEYVLGLWRDPCAYCGGPAGFIDHIVPISRGGQSSLDNLAPCCASCNSRKGDQPLLQFLAKAGARYGASDGGARARTGQKT